MKKLISILFVLLITFNFFSQQQITKTLFFDGQKVVAFTRPEVLKFPWYLISNLFII